MSDNLKFFQYPRSLWKTIFALIMTFGLVSQAQAAALKLLPGAELASIRLQPGTLMQEPPPLVPSATPLDSKVNSWQGGLHIEILEGDRGVNIIKKKTAVTPVVEVRDRNNLPIAGVVVVFSSPSDGPSVTFLNGSRSFSVVTDAHGQASATALKPMNSGYFQLKVSASYQGEVAGAVIAMTNVLTAAEAANGPGGTGAGAGTGLSHLTIGILVGVAAAAAVGVAVGLSGHSSSSSAAAGSPTATIGVGGSGAVGAPH